MNDHTEKYGRRSNDTEVFGRKNDVATGKDILDVLEASYGAFAERITTVMTSTIVGNERLKAAFEEYWANEGEKIVRSEFAADFASSYLFTDLKSMEYFVRNQTVSMSMLGLWTQNLIHNKLGIGNDSRSYQVSKSA